jgi:hypothetical protein
MARSPGRRPPGRCNVQEVIGMNTQAVMQSPYLAALKMLKEVIAKCPPSMWDAARDKDRFWYRAQHALHWAQVDLRAALDGFRPWSGRTKPHAGAPVFRHELLEQLTFVEQQVARRRGFRPAELERLIAGLRHIQHHTGELYERLGSRQKVTPHWTEKVRRKKI